MVVEWDDAVAHRMQTKPHRSRSVAAQVWNTNRRHDNCECL